MAATVTIRRLTGAGPTVSASRTEIRASTSDNDYTTADTANPIPIPAAGTNYSFWVTERLNADTSPSGTIDNLRWYTDGTNSSGTGVTWVAQDASSYVQATGTTGTTGTQLTTGNHAGLSGAPVDPFTNFTTGSPKSLTGSISNPSTGQFGDRMVWQIAVATTAGPGTLTAEPFTWRYDET